MSSFLQKLKAAWPLAEPAPQPGTAALIALAAVSGALGMLGMAPFPEMLRPVAAVLHLWPLFYFAERLSGSLPRLLAAGLLSSFFCSLFAFHWFTFTIRSFGDLPLPAAFAVFLVIAFFFQLKFPMFVVLFGLARRDFGRRYLRPAWFVAGLLCAVVDLTVPQLFPWYWGNLLAGSTAFAQLAEYGGASGLSFLLGAGSYWSYRYVEGLRTGRGLLSSSVQILAVPAAVLALFILGEVRYYGYQIYQDGLPTVRVAILQPLAPLELQPITPRRERAALQLIEDVIPELARQAGEHEPQLIVLPESGVPYYTTSDFYLNRRRDVYRPEYRRMAEEMAAEHRAALILNEVNFTVEDADEGIRAQAKNSAALFRPETRDDEIRGERTAGYDKRRLLAFGEYVPGEDWWEFFGLTPYLPSVLQRSRFYPGDRAATLRYRDGNGSGKLLPTICYEIIFPDYVRRFERETRDAELLVNLTQDGWYGNTFETYQHLELGRLRAVELRRALVRANNNGVSVFIDVTGRPIEPLLGPRMTAFGERNVMVADVPVHVPEPTLYARVGDWWLLGAVVILLGTIAANIFRQRSP